MATEAQTLTTESRAAGDKGKSAARRLRGRGLIPAVFYGPDAAATSIAVAPKALAQALGTAHRRNALLKIEVGGQQHYAMVKELQIHPVTRAPLHVDLYEVSLDREVSVDVPFTTEGRAKGVIAGGEVNAIFRALPVRATPDKIPAVITVDVTNMELNTTVKTKDLSLPEGVTVALDAERNLVTCAEPRKRQTEEEEAAAAGAATPEAGAAAAAGASKAPPAAKPG
jgi:large subunit ribosomal protein L25